MVRTDGLQTSGKAPKGVSSSCQKAAGKVVTLIQSLLFQTQVALVFAVFLLLLRQIV